MKLKNLFGSIKKDKLILIFLVGILLVIIKLPTKNTSKKDSNEYNIQSSAGKTVTNDYAIQIESRLEEILSKVTGVGNTKVSVVIKDSGKSILDVKEEENHSSKIEKEDKPEIQGVLIVAEGAGNVEVISEITDAVSALLGISVNKIKVLKMEA